MKIAVPRANRPTSREAQPHRPASRTSAVPTAIENVRKTSASLAGEIALLLQSCQSSRDRFQSNSLLAQLWLVQLRKRTEDRVATHASAGDRQLQTGHAWRSFARLFYPLSPIDSVRLFENLLRFANYSDFPPARAFFLAYAPLAFEHDVSGEYIGPGVWTPKAGSSRAALRVRRTLRRWCEWLEALTHFQIHQSNHPASPHLDLDKAILVLWPLLRRHHWSYADLLKVLRGSLGSDETCPSRFEEQFAKHCTSTLGLPKPSSLTAVRAGVLPGQEVAERVMRFLATIN